jgi:dihydropyrimidinase
MALLIKGGEIVTADARSRSDIFIEDETITQHRAQIAPAPGHRNHRCTGKLIFPGFIDPHVHIHLPSWPRLPRTRMPQQARLR